MSVCPFCGSKLVEVTIPETDMEMVAGILVERETQDYRLMCPVSDCYEAAESEPDTIPF